MKILPLETYTYIHDELNEFVTLCNKYRYVPTKQDYEEIIKFLLLYQSGTTTLCESKENLEFITEHFSSEFQSIFEKGGGSTYDPEADWDNVTDLVGNVGKAALAAGGLALVGAGIGAMKAGSWIKYMWKKGKVKKSVKAEMDAEMQKINDYIQLNKLLAKRAKLKGESSWESEIPSIAS